MLNEKVAGLIFVFHLMQENHSRLLVAVDMYSVYLYMFECKDIHKMYSARRLLVYIALYEHRCQNQTVVSLQTASANHGLTLRV